MKNILAAIILYVLLSSQLYAMGGADASDNKPTRAGNPDQLTTDILDETHDPVAHDDVPEPSHHQISNAEIQENKARLACMKLQPLKRKKCLENL